MKNRNRYAVVLFLFFIGVGFVFGTVAQAAWIEGTIGYVKQIRVDAATVDYEIRLDRAGDTPVYRFVFADNLNEFLAIALTAQANGSTVKLQYETNAAGRGWYGIMLVSP